MRQGFRTFDALLLVAVALIMFLLSGPVLLIPLHIPLSYNEGWNAYFSQRAIQPQTGPLYPPADSLVFNNYPPLSFYLVGALGRYVIGDIIVAGRIVALTSMLACALLVGICVRLLGGSGRGSLAASSLLLLYATTFFRDYVAIYDPQWLAHAMMLSGLAVLLNSRKPTCPTTGAAVAAALLMTAGGFVKQNLVGLPLAVTAWLLLTAPRAATAWLATAAAGVAAGSIATGLMHGQAAFADILQHRRIIRLGRLTKAVERLLPLLPMLVIAVLGFRRRLAGDRPMLLASLFVSTSLVTGIVQRLGEGVNYNAYFETMIALCLTTGLAASRPFVEPPARRDRPAASVLVVLFAALPVLLTMPRHWERAWTDLHGRVARATSWQPIIARIATSPGQVACENLSLCFWAGRPFAIDQFNLNQSILLGGPTARLDGIIRTHVFGVVEYDGNLVLGTPPGNELGHDPLLLKLLSGGYRPTSGGPDGIVLLKPRPAPPGDQLQPGR